MRTWKIAPVTLGILGVLAAQGCAADVSDVPEPTEEVSQEAAMSIAFERELVITDLGVVEDPTRTHEPCAAATTAGGALGPWTFGYLVQQMAGAHDPVAFVTSWLTSWAADQTVNGYLVPGRANIHSLVIDPWLARSGGVTLDLAEAPFRLLAITSRMDLGRAKDGDAGEGRFVFGVVDPEDECRKLPFTVIFEYALPSQDACDVAHWAEQWHALGSLPFGPAYNQALEAITAQFAQAGAIPSRPNGSALNQLRTNEKALGNPWELREFRVDAGGLLHETTVKQTPDMSLNGAAALADFINANEGKAKKGRHVVPDAWLGGAAPTPFSLVWDAPGINDPDARHGFAITTCSGCHRTETGAIFTHVSTREAGVASNLSAYLTGTTVNDPVTGQPRDFAELERREKQLTKLVKMKCHDDADVEKASADVTNHPH